MAFKNYFFAYLFSGMTIVWLIHRLSRYQGMEISSRQVQRFMLWTKRGNATFVGGTFVVIFVVILETLWESPELIRSGLVFLSMCGLVLTVVSTVCAYYWFYQLVREPQGVLSISSVGGMFSSLLLILLGSILRQEIMVDGAFIVMLLSVYIWQMEIRGKIFQRVIISLIVGGALWIFLFSGLHR